MRLGALFLPRFPLQRLVLEQPSLSGQPIVLHADDRGSQRVHFASAAAIKLGLRPGMTVSAAAAIVPGVVKRPFDLEAETKALGSLSERLMAATPAFQVDTPEVRVTEWRLAPGSATGHHTHEMDYVIVPVTSGEMTIVAPNGERSKAQLGVGKSYFRKAGVQHDVLNETASEIVFLEVELKP